MSRTAGRNGSLVIGWREWVALPELGIDRIKAKIDTGARTSALHAFAVRAFRDRGTKYACFGVHPLQRDRETEIWCTAEIIDERRVADSGGHREWRYVIGTHLHMSGSTWPIELTLTARDTMLFRMLVGRTAIPGLRVDPMRSYLTGRRPSA